MKEKIIEIYESYGFSLQKDYTDDNVLVFLMQSGYFRNVDIVPYSEHYNKKKAQHEFSTLGYSCTAREYLSSETIEKLLFNGFFSIKENKERITSDYTKFTQSIVNSYGENSPYKYLTSPYFIDGSLGEQGIIDEILNKLTTEKPTLFLVEAAAGFGKTCTSYELVSKINCIENKIPLFAELSRNRQARIFKHVLLDEIDRSFPFLNSSLVHKEIINGRVVVVLDGFDELLRNLEDEDEFKSKEPMLETIGEYLRGSAKIIMTTRRTILFDGDNFHKWIEKNEDIFDLVRIRITEPNVTDWLDPDRIPLLTQSGIDIKNIANPVLLSYLRSLPMEEFKTECLNPEGLVDSYFNFMLERERKRQDLKIDITGQNIVLSSVAKDMMDFEYKSESRDYIVNHILANNLDLIEKAISQYPPEAKPTQEEIANKLASHALLDRSSRNPNKIGFINEFVLGHYVAKVIANEDNWMSDDWSFIEPCILAYMPRSIDSKEELYRKISSSLEHLDNTRRVHSSSALRGKIDFDLISGEVNNLVIRNIVIGDYRVEKVQFNECTFTECEFSLNNFLDVSFLNCQFYDCSIKNEHFVGSIHILGCSGDSQFINEISELSKSRRNDHHQEAQAEYNEAEVHVITRFWPIGRDTISHKHRPIKGIVSSHGALSVDDVYEAIYSLKKKEILVEPISAGFLEINFEKIHEIRKALGKQ